MGALLVVVMVLVGVGAAAVVTSRRPLHQAMMVGLFGLSLTLLFFAFQAPDVALSEMTVGAVVLPMMILLAATKTKRAG